MAKFEEITALIIEELETLQDIAKDIKKESIQLQNTKISIDARPINATLNNFYKKIQQQKTDLIINTSPLETILNNFNEETIMIFSRIGKKLFQIENKLQKNIRIPKWFIITFITNCALLCSSVFCNFHLHYSNGDKELQAFQKGKNELNSHMQSFFVAKPNAFKTYKNWIEKK